jgi:putative AlgH/UPF0301 family transcriptional regulator
VAELVSYVVLTLSTKELGRILDDSSLGNDTCALVIGMTGWMSTQLEKDCSERLYVRVLLVR